MDETEVVQLHKLYGYVPYVESHIADSVQDPAAVAVDQCMQDVLGYTKPWIGQPSFGWFSISTWSHCFGISSGQSAQEIGPYIWRPSETYCWIILLSPLAVISGPFRPFLCRMLKNCLNPISITPLEPIKAKYIMGKLSLHNHSNKFNRKSSDFFYISTYPPLQSFWVLLGPATCITPRSFLVLDEIGSD